MPRKQELTAVKVLDYFGTAPYEAVVLVLQLATSAVKMRAPKVVEKVSRKPAAASNAAVDAATRSVGTTQPPATTTGQGEPVGRPRARRQIPPPAAPSTGTGAGTTLETAAKSELGPGLPGMATV